MPLSKYTKNIFKNRLKKYNRYVVEKSGMLFLANDAALKGSTNIQKFKQEFALSHRGRSVPPFLGQHTLRTACIRSGYRALLCVFVLNYCSDL